MRHPQRIEEQNNGETVRENRGPGAHNRALNPVTEDEHSKPITLSEQQLRVRLFRQPDLLVNYSVTEYSPQDFILGLTIDYLS